MSGRRRTLAPIALALAASAIGCGAPGEEPAGPAPLALSARGAEAWTPRLLALRQAVDAGDELLARRTLAGILASDPEEEVLEVALAFERILDGRALVAALQLALETRPHEASPFHYELYLTGRHEFEEEVVLATVPPTLRRTVTALDPDGAETTGLLTKVPETLAEIRVPPGGAVELFLGTYVAPIGGALGLRDDWSLDLRAGEVRRGTEGYPAQELPSPTVTTWFRAPFLPTEPVEPDELARYAHRESIAPAALVERAVRLDPARHEEALLLLEPVVRVADDDRVRALAPALRWLTGVREGGPGPDGWRALLAQRATEARAGATDDLDLPSAESP